MKWSNKQRDGHSLHQIPYRACFKPSLVTAFVEEFTKPGDRVYDPFSGRGTVALEAALLGREVVANDLNPLARHLLLPRLNPPHIAEVESRLSVLDLSYDGALDEDLLVFYHTKTLRELMAYRETLGNDSVDSWIRLCLLSRLTGHSSGYLSVYTLPPNQAASVASQRKINAKFNQVPDYKDSRNIVMKKTRQLLRDPLPSTFPPSHLITIDDARRNLSVGAGSVDFLLTSPPFVAEVAYTDDNWLRNWFIGESPVELDEGHREFEWTNFIFDVLTDARRVIRSGGTLAMEVGNTKKVNLAQIVEDLCLRLKFKNVKTISQQHDSSKTAQIWGVTSGKGTNKSFIVTAIR